LVVGFSFYFKKNKRVVVAKTKITKTRTTGKAVSKKQTKRKITKIKDKAKEDLDSEGDNLSDEFKESEVVYIKEKTLVIKKQKAKNIIKIIVLKRNIRLVAKRI
jgi:hypothetical protein